MTEYFMILLVGGWGEGVGSQRTGKNFNNFHDTR